MAADPLSPLADVRRVPLAELDELVIAEAVRRILPETPAVPGTSSNSAI